MRIRAQDASGDYVCGKSGATFFVNSSAAVAQNVLTTLLLIQGEWFLDNTAGMPWMTQVLGFNSKDAYDLAIKSTILSVIGVTALVSYGSNLNSAGRKLSVNATINTQFGVTSVQTVISVTQGG